jgi:hypothetical protein
MIGSGALGGSCRRQHAAAPISVARRPHTASPAGHLVPGPRMIARPALFDAMIVIQATDLKTRYRSLAEEMPPQFEVNSLNVNLVAL